MVDGRMFWSAWPASCGHALRAAVRLAPVLMAAFSSSGRTASERRAVKAALIKGNKEAWRDAGGLSRNRNGCLLVLQCPWSESGYEFPGSTAPAGCDRLVLLRSKQAKKEVGVQSAAMAVGAGGRGTGACRLTIRPRRGSERRKPYSRAPGEAGFWKQRLSVDGGQLQLQGKPGKAVQVTA
jgi:hypothetical protein